jgi:high-affinity iron transporter
MILIHALLAVSLLAPGDSVPAQAQAPVVRRIASMAALAAQEYAVGVENGRIVAAAEVDEARLFLEEARRATARLAEPERGRVAASLDSLLSLVNATASPALLARRTRSMSDGIAQRFGITMDEIPVAAPLLSRGKEVYTAACASCHGSMGLGDGAAGKDLDPPPANLTDAVALRDASPLDFYRRVTIGVAGTAMPAFETALTADDRWAVAVYSTLLRLPKPQGAIPDSLANFQATAARSDASILADLGVSGEPTQAELSRLAAVRAAGTAGQNAQMASLVFAEVRSRIDSSVALAAAGQLDDAEARALDAYISFEQVERTVRAKDPGLAAELEAAFADLRARAGAGGSDVASVKAALDTRLERAEQVFADRSSPTALFTQSFLLMLREGLEAILVVGALLTFLTRAGAGHRRKEIHWGVLAAIGASILTAIGLETIFRLSPSHQEALEGGTMLVAVAVLFYVSYWLLSKMEVTKWTSFVKSRVQSAVTSGSALALASAAFLAVYREGFETILFYKALFASGGIGDAAPLALGLVAGIAALIGVYIAINRFGIRLPLKPFFGATSVFLYVMAFIFAGKGIAELQAGRVLPITYVPGAPHFSPLGMYPTVETMIAQGTLLGLALVALCWIFLVVPARERRTQVEATPVPVEGEKESTDLIRSLERVDTDLAEARAELERLRERLGAEKGS